MMSRQIFASQALLAINSDEEDCIVDETERVGNGDLPHSTALLEEDQSVNLTQANKGEKLVRSVVLAKLMSGEFKVRRNMKVKIGKL